MELEEVTRILNIKDNTASFNKEKERRKIEIQEVRVFDYLWKYSLEILYSYGILRSYSYEFLKFCVFILVINEDILTDYNDKIFLLLW